MWEWDQICRSEIRKVNEIAKGRRWEKTYCYVIEERRWDKSGYRKWIILKKGKKSKTGEASTPWPLWHNSCACSPPPVMLPRKRTLQIFPIHLSYQFYKQKGHSWTVMEDFLSFKHQTGSGSWKLIIMMIKWILTIIPQCLFLAVLHGESSLFLLITF